MTAVSAQAASGTGWRVVFQHHYGAKANPSSYTSMVMPGQKDAWAFGDNDDRLDGGRTPVARHWNGKSWRAVTLPGGLRSGIDAASATSPSNIWAVGAFGEYALHWNGTKWSVAKRWKGRFLMLTGVTALSRRNVWVFGTRGHGPGLGTWHYNGHRWTKVGGVAANITKASALSARNIWALGSSDVSTEDTIVHYNGTRWTPESASALKNAAFTDIVAVSRGNVWATGNAGGTPLLFHWNGTHWRKVSVPWKVTPRQAISDGTGGLWMTAGSNKSRTIWVLHRPRSGTWSRTRIGSGGAGIFELARVPGTGAVLGAGAVATAISASAAIYAHGRVG